MTRLYPNEQFTADLLKAVCDGIYYCNFEQYVEMLKQASLRRKLVALADEVATSARDVTEDMFVLTDQVRAKLRDMIQTQSAWHSMRNTGASPSVARESTLSQILQANAPERYYLSATACLGILRRAERRGKELPVMLREALEEVVALNA